MSWIRLLLLTLGLALPLASQDHVTNTQGRGHPAPVSTMQMKDSEFFEQQYVHLMPHALWEPPISPDPAVRAAVTFYDVNLAQLIALALILLLFIPVKASFHGGSTNWVIRVFRGWVHWIRDEMVYAVMGKEAGRKYVPYFCYLFFFIAFMNLIGLVPGSVTATASICVTGAMALVTFMMIVGGGIREQGFLAYFKNLLPHGLPIALMPLMVVVEAMGLIIKPVALAIRLFANMLAGHLVIYSFIGLIFLFAKMMNMGVFAWATAIPAIGMAVFIYVIESFITLLQAYIFTYLSLIFVQLALHPDH
jgi:F-type H+-transporting ATPase subunit a